MRRALDFEGRASRSEYLWFLAAATGALTAVIAICHLALPPRGAWIGTAVTVALLYVPVTSAGVRRLHDAGHRGTMMLDPLAPAAGFAIVAAILLWVPPFSWLTRAVILVAIATWIIRVPLLLLAGIVGFALAVTVALTLAAFSQTMGHLLLPSEPAGPPE